MRKDTSGNAFHHNMSNFTNFTGNLDRHLSDIEHLFLDLSDPQKHIWNSLQ